MVAVHRVAADCSAVLGHGGRLRNSLSFGSSNSPRRPLAARGATRHGLRASPPPKSPRPPPTHPWSPRWWRGTIAAVACHQRGEQRAGTVSGGAPGLVLRWYGRLPPR